MDILKTSTARGRLAQYRAAAEKSGKNWRAHVATICPAADFGAGFNEKTPVYYSFDRDSVPAVSIDFADEIDRTIRHTGYFADANCYGDRGTIRGAVYRLDGRRWLAGYYSSDNGEWVIYADEIYDSATDAASSADHYADRAAESERDYDAKFLQARAIEDETEEKRGRLRECLALRNNRAFEYIRPEIRELIEKIRQNRETLQTEFSDFI